MIATSLRAIVNGGLVPTVDDLSREIAAIAAGADKLASSNGLIIQPQPQLLEGDIDLDDVRASHGV